ncbi:TrmH family RNA methyltransferase [Hanstruepera marina]|uniref:TrmH family RNA methyltransferase n=1 Tax=Hanstruepera marina TaxID=2873265 RepID=UPI001CA7A888|nr:TrmH family RNA methyltransferase [Hanstruepera marina]
MQLTHYNSKFKEHVFPITIICDNISNAPNVGSLFRIADAFGVKKIIFCGNNITMGRKMTKTSRATEQYVSYQVQDSAFTETMALKEKGYQIIALEITDNSTPIGDILFSNSQPIALLIGDENFGVSENVLKLSDKIVHIEMFGKNSSMNVVQATNIALYEITKQLNVNSNLIKE